MKKSLIVITILGLLVAVIPVSAAKPAAEDTEPVEGTFDVQGRPDMKVRVFVYREKPVNQNGKPTPPPPTLQCDLLDPDSGAVIGDAGWTLPSAITYRLNPSSVPASVGGSNLDEITDRGFAEWSAEIQGAVALTRGPDTSAVRAALDGQNIIAWGRISGSALGVTRVWYYTDTGVVAEVDTIMNTKFVWTWTDQNTDANCAMTNSYDAQNIMTHELGHWYGLNDHYTSDYVNNTMYGYGSKTETKKNTVTTGDSTGLQALYP